MAPLPGRGPLNGGFCSFCTSRAGNSFAYDPNPNSFNDSPSVFTHPPQLQFETYLCELCGNNAHYGYDCPPQFPLVYEQEPCHNQNFNDNYFPQNSQSSSQQYICCQNCGGPHATFECQPMSQNLYNSNSSGFDQFQPPQFPVIHQPPQETSAEILQARENLMNSIQTFLKKFNRISFRETPKVLTRAWEKFFEIQHAQPEDIQELLHKLLKDLQIISEEMAEYINLPSWNRPAYYYEDDDEEYTIAITPDLPTEEPDNSLSMGDEHLSTIPETESDEVIKSSVENLVPIPSEPEDFSDIEKMTSQEHDELYAKMNFKTYSNPFFDLDVEINSSKFNSTHNEDLDSTPKDVRFDVESYLLESLVNRDTLMASSPKIDFLLDEFAGELTRLQSIPPGIDNINLDPEGDILEEIDILHSPDDSIPPGIESDDFDSEDDDNSTSLPEFESFHVDYPDSGDSTIDLVEDIPVDVPNILPTYPVLQLDFDFIPSNDLGSDHDVSSPSGDRNKIYDPGICIEVKSTRFLATLSPVIDTLLPFSSENEDKVFNHGVLASKKKLLLLHHIRALNLPSFFIIKARC
ncbi:hypothetical protein Tco_1174775 [Tanacetum coccineum]